MDLVALNLQRGRDHGIAPYIRWRQLCGLSQLNGWKDLSEAVSSPQVMFIEQNPILTITFEKVISIQDAF